MVTVTRANGVTCLNEEHLDGFECRDIANSAPAVSGHWHCESIVYKLVRLLHRGHWQLITNARHPRQQSEHVAHARFQDGRIFLGALLSITKR